MESYLKIKLMDGETTMPAIVIALQQSEIIAPGASNRSILFFPADDITPLEMCAAFAFITVGAATGDFEQQWDALADNTRRHFVDVDEFIAEQETNGP